MSGPAGMRQPSAPRWARIGAQPWVDRGRGYPVGAGAIRGRAPLGIDLDRGLVIAGSRRVDFPTEVETLVLKLAVNQAVIALHAGCLPAERQPGGLWPVERHPRWRGSSPGPGPGGRAPPGRRGRTQQGHARGVQPGGPGGAHRRLRARPGGDRNRQGVIARALHRLSTRRARPFVTVNCAAIPDGLLESELFGHERGAFTGAHPRIGRFEQADGGTMFLDEIGEMPLGVQAKLLRVLQEREFDRVGGTRPDAWTCASSAATNRDLEDEVSQRGFRADLFCRLASSRSRCPPLRERAEDIPRWPALRRSACPPGQQAHRGVEPDASTPCALIAGRGTCASWRTSSSAA